jgi:PiT family inorganic phosphate transporter
MSIVGLGWGRATRTTKVAEGVRGEETPRASVGALAADEETATVGDPTVDGEKDPEPIGQEDPSEVPAASELFNPSTTARVVIMQNVVPIFATIGSYVTFLLLFAAR